MNLSNIDKILAFREAGNVRRAHTIPYAGEYNIAMHCYNALNILFVLYPRDPSINLIKAIQWHDTPERWTGDIPSPAKSANPMLRSFLGTLEEDIFKKLGIEKFFKSLTKDETQWLNAVDLLELFFWVRDQINLGNRAVTEMHSKIMEMFKVRLVTTPVIILQVLETYTWHRLPECDEFLKGV